MPYPARLQCCPKTCLHTSTMVGLILKGRSLALPHSLTLNCSLSQKNLPHRKSTCAEPHKPPPTPFNKKFFSSLQLFTSDHTFNASTSTCARQPPTTGNPHHHPSPPITNTSTVIKTSLPSTMDGGSSRLVSFCSLTLTGSLLSTAS